MPLISAIDPETLRAYRETDYRVLGSLPATLHIGEPCPELLLLHEKYQVRCSAFITAWNPLGRPVTAQINTRRQQALMIELSRRAPVAVAAIGQHPGNEWPGEPSFLVPGLMRSAAQDLGRQFEQNAIIWSGADAVPELILLR